MATKLDKTIKREIEIDGTAYTVAVSPDGVKLTQKGFRKGQEMSWTSLLAGSSAEGGAGGGSGATRAASAPGTPLAGVTTAGATDASRSGWRPADVATDAEDAADESRNSGGSRPNM